MEQRKSLVYCGATDEDVEALPVLGKSFYGYAIPESDSKYGKQWLRNFRWYR